jgi:hypothetical protein
MALRNPIRTLALCVLAGAVAAAGAPAAASAARPKPRLSDCQKLAKRKDLAKDRKLVLVVRGNDETGRISACVLPRGRIRTLSSWDDGLSRDWASVVATAGLYVLVEDGHGDQYGGASRALTRVHVRSGRRLALSGWGCQLGSGGPPHCTDGSDYGEIAMAATGAGAYEVTNLASGRTTLQAFDAAGTFSKLADGAVDGLRVTPTQVQWTQAGTAFAAPLP